MLNTGLSAAESAKLMKGRKQASKALSNARQRCTNKKNKDYEAYGAVGIQVLIGLDDLIAAIGLPPKNASLDRTNPHGHYEAGNVRWATKAVQAINKKSSLAGGTLPLHSLIAQSKLMAEQEKLRPKVTEAWHLVHKAFNYGNLSAAESAILADNLEIVGPPNEKFRSHQTLVGGKGYASFLLPSLTFPNGFVRARGSGKAAPDGEHARRYLRQGLLFRLSDIERTINVPTPVWSAIIHVLEGDSPGLTLVGRPTQDDLEGGWFEVWMLAVASRLPQFNVGTALFPALSCLEHLREFGGPHQWDEVNHPLLDAQLLFIPDFQLDCGPWGYLSPYQFGALERLLSYRADMGHKTVLGVQAPSKLGIPLQKLLLGGFAIRQIANGTSPQIGIASSGPQACTENLVGAGECQETADDFEKSEGV